MRRALPWLLIIALTISCHPSQLGPSPARAPTPASAATPSASPPAAPAMPALTGTSAAMPVPTPSSTPLPVAADDLNVLLLGTDRRINHAEDLTPWRTDTLIVVAIRPRSRLIAMLSIPRDLWVNIPGYGEERINVADHLGEERDGPGGGPALVGATLEENLGIPIHAYARVHFQGLEQIIDTLGGVTVTSERAFSEWMDDWSGQRLVHIEVVTGTQRMDGQTALGYARSRLTTSDFDRSRRQQQILLAVRDAALRPEVLPRLPWLLRALSNAVDSDLPATRVLSLIGLALRLRAGNYRGRVFDSTMVTDWVTPEGAMVLLPERARIEQVWAELTAPEEP